MANPTWGMLSKAQDDDEKIEEAIVRLISEHNANEEAHLGAGQSLQSHKASEIIDHLVASIVADKIARFSVDVSKFFGDTTFLITGFESLDHWTLSKDGNGYTAPGVLGFVLNSGSAVGNWAMIHSYSQLFGGGVYNYDKDIVFQTTVAFYNLTNEESYITLGEIENEWWGFGFRTENNKLFSISRFGGNEQKTEILTLASSVKYVLRAEYLPAENKILFFVDGVLMSTHTNAIGEGSSDLGMTYYIKTLTAAHRKISVADLVISTVK